ncbi:MAG: anaerobic ribonucleoside-triphosphate reductase activating protein [Pseudomonadota bacterium]
MSLIPSIKGFIEASFLDWPGKIVSVLFLPNCNFRCPFCHNHRLVKDGLSLEEIPLDQILARLSKLRGWIDGVCITGGEPTLHEGLTSLIAAIRAEGFLVKLDTNGTHPEILRYLVRDRLLDEVAMDIKSPLREHNYSVCAGVPVSVQQIEESIDLLMGCGVAYSFRTTVVPGLLEEDDIYEIARRVKGATRLLLQNFNPHDPLDPALKHTKPYSEESLAKMQEKVNRIILP